MTLPGNIGTAVPDGPDWLVRAVRDLQREVAQLRTAMPANATSIYCKSTSTINPTVPVNPTTKQHSAYAMQVQTITVPEGYTSAEVFVSATMLITDGGSNGTTSGNTMYVWADPNYDPNSTATLSQYAAQDIDDSQISQAFPVTASATHTSGATLTGLTPGSTIQVAACGFVTFGLKVQNEGNLAALSAFVVFSR